MGNCGIWMILVAGAAAAAGCSRSSAQEYQLEGQVLAVDRTRQEITLKHEDIPRFMPGMTMAFKVRDRALLADRIPGELVKGTLIVEKTEVHLGALERTGFAPLAEPARLPGPNVLHPGEPVADATLLDETGARRTLAEWRGNVIAVTFVYTRCPIPDFCPRMDRHFRAVQEQVRTDDRLAGRVRLLSVSFDPEHDTPPVLAAHAAAVKADSRVWRFVTGRREDVERFAAQFGVSIVRDDPAAMEILHNLRTAIVDREGRLVAVLTGSDWMPTELVAALRQAHEGR